MTHLKITELTPTFGVEISGFDPKAPLDDATRKQLQDLFDTRKLLIFRDIDLPHPDQTRIGLMLIGKEHEFSLEKLREDNFYISNKRAEAAAPFGRLQFHADTMWAEKPFEVLSLYGVEVEQPAASTTFVNGVDAWNTLPDDLRKRIEGLEVLHTAGAVRRGDMSGVLVTEVDNPPYTITKLGLRHPRTGETVLYACEQMTKEIVGLPHDESEAILKEVFDHLYRPEGQLEHHWREGDYAVWDNIALQHARGPVSLDGPARTLRKAASPMPQLRPDQIPAWKKEAV